MYEQSYLENIAPVPSSSGSLASLALQIISSIRVQLAQAQLVAGGAASARVPKYPAVQSFQPPVDRFNSKLTNEPRKTHVACPLQTARPMVLAMLTMANHKLANRRTLVAFVWLDACRYPKDPFCNHETKGSPHPHFHSHTASPQIMARATLPCPPNQVSQQQALRLSRLG